MRGFDDNAAIQTVRYNSMLFIFELISRGRHSSIFAAAQDGKVFNKVVKIIKGNLKSRNSIKTPNYYTFFKSLELGQYDINIFKMFQAYQK